MANNATIPSIRIGRKDILRIEVNDAGECIELDFGDRNFFYKFFKLGEVFEQIAKEFEQKPTEQAQEDGGDLSTFEKYAPTIKRDEEMHRRMAQEIDNVFGAGTCVKVFGNDCPSADLITEFMEAIQPFVRAEAEKRKKTINTKYTANRKGGKR